MQTQPVPAAESALIGAILLNAPATLREILPPLTLSDFTDPAARAVWQWATERAGAGLPVDLALAADALRGRVSVEAIEGFVDSCATVAHSGSYADEVREASKRRGLVSLADRVNAIACRPDTAPDLLRDEIAAAVEATRTATPGALAPVAASGWLTSEPPPPDYVLSGVFEIGDRALLVAPSKCRKSFFALQLAASVAAGFPFLEIETPAARRVLFVTLENRAAWEHRRLRGICRAGKIQAADLGDPCRLGFICCRGQSLSVAEIGTAAAAFRAELVIVDPTYALSDSGDELDQTARREMLHAVARVAAAGPAVILVAHDPKGQAGDRDTRDRGSGSNLVNRAVDATLALTPYGDSRDPEADSVAVLSVLARNAPPRPDVCIRFYDGAFTVDPDRAPVKATSRNRNLGDRPARDLDGIHKAALRIVDGKPVPAHVFDTRLQRAASIGEKASRAARADMTEAGVLAISRREPKPGGCCYVGTTAQVETLHREWQLA